MKTCPKCGISYDNQEGKCPLCERDGSETVFEHRKKDAFTKEFYWRLFSIFSVAASFIIIVIDLVYSRGLSWSIIPLISVLYLWSSLFMIVKTRLKSNILIFLEWFIAIILLSQLDRFISGKPWFTGIAFPVMIILYMLLNLTLLIFKIRYLTILQRTALGVINMGIFLILLELLLNNYHYYSISFSWSLIAFVCLLPLSIFLIYLDKKIKRSGEELKKYFHF